MSELWWHLSDNGDYWYNETNEDDDDNDSDDVKKKAMKENKQNC